MKAQHPHSILFYRVGDFYEMFHEDATLAARILDITLTSRGDGVPLAGVPVKAAAEYLRQLVAAGHRVAICEQVEDPRLAKGLVRREVVETVTPGALLAEGWIPGARNNWMAALARPQRGGLGLAAVDLSTGEFLLETVPGDGLEEALTRLNPAEVVVAEDDQAALPAEPVSAAPHPAQRVGVRSRACARRPHPALQPRLARRARHRCRRHGGRRGRRRAAPLRGRAPARRAAAPGAARDPPERTPSLARRHDPSEPRAGRAAPRRCPRLRPCSRCSIAP